MKFLLFSFALLFLLIGAGQSQEKEAKVEKKEEAKKQYSEKEFNEEVNKRIMLKLKKIQKQGLVKFSEQLLKKEQDLKDYEKLIEVREEQLDLNEKEFSAQLKKFNLRQGRFLGCIDKQDLKKEERIEHMVSVLSGMRPVQASQVLSVQDVIISVELLGRLPPEKVSKIFNTMDKEISARLQKQYMNMKR